MIRAARVAAAGAAPELVDLDEPPGAGDVDVEIAAFALNPIDVNVALGRFYGGTPPLPYVAGVEAVGRAGDGRTVYVNGPGIGITRDGVWAERVRVPATAVHAVPDGADDATALACGVAGLAGWIPVVWRAGVGAGDRVLVLGATGTVGRTAVQAAKLRGAFVVGAGRREDALAEVRELGADDTVVLDEAADLAERLEAAFADAPPTVVVDGTWGPPLVAALAVAARGARVVNVGQSAAPEATITSNSVRGKQLTIYGYSNYAVPADVFERSYRELVEQAAAGRVRFRIETYPVDALADAWERQAGGPAAKLVVRF